MPPLPVDEPIMTGREVGRMWCQRPLLLPVGEHHYKTLFPISHPLPQRHLGTKVLTLV